MRCDGRTPSTPTRSSRALGALRMRILKVMTLSVMHKDHSLDPSRILHVQPLTNCPDRLVYLCRSRREHGAARTGEPAAAAEPSRAAEHGRAGGSGASTDRYPRTRRRDAYKHTPRLVLDRSVFVHLARRGSVDVDARPRHTMTTNRRAAPLLHFSRSRTSRHFTEKQRQSETPRTSRSLDTHDDRLIIPLDY